MEEQKINDHMITLEELVLDEEKIVSVTYLSKLCGVHVNESKRLLKIFVDKTKESKPNLTVNVNYLISGFNVENEACTLVCSEEDLNKTRNSMKTIIFEHLYSVNKGSTAVDKVALIAINNIDDFSLTPGIIKSEICVKQTVDELKLLKSKINKSPIKNRLEVITKRGVPSKRTENTDTIVETVKSEIISPVKEPTKQSPIKICKSEFETQISKKKSETNGNPKQPSKSHGIASFFTKQNVSQQKNKLKKESETNTEKHVKPTEKKAIKPKEDEVKTIQSEKQNIPDKDHRESIKKVESSKSKSKIQNNIKKVNISKKRKRILHLSDSETEDDIFDEDPVEQSVESEDEIPPTPSVGTVKVTSGLINSKKRRKIIDKTYTDEDGYILTKKEEIYESCSEDETESKENVVQSTKNKNDIVVKKTVEKEIIHKKTSPAKGKQASIMNFFKKLS